MIPSFDPEIYWELPEEELWLPSSEELAGDEGFGTFRDTWVIASVPLGHAQSMLQLEQAGVRLADLVSQDPASFERVLAAIDANDSAELHEGDREDEHVREWFARRDGLPAPSEGLDIGVAGLVYALGSIGCYPAASCRGHGTPNSWAPWPVVRFAATRTQATLLMEMAQETLCGMIYEDDGLLSLWAASITQTMQLAAALVQLAEFEASNR